jgi:hypothetical protein
MAAIITEKFRLHNAKQFFESFNETGSDETDTLNSRYYFFIGKSSPYIAADNYNVAGVSDSIPPLPVDDVTTENYVWDAMLAAKRINSSDISYVIPRKNWTSSSFFADMYDNTIRPQSASDPTGNVTRNGYTSLWESDFYFITSNFGVYIVLYNDKGSEHSGSEPSATDTGEEPFWNGNYLLKYMYTLSNLEVDRYYTSNFMAVPTNRTSVITNGDGKIHVVNITNSGSGYTGSNGDGPYFTPIKGDGTGAILKFYITGGTISDFGSNEFADTVIINDTSLASNLQNTGYTYGYVDLVTPGNVYTSFDAATGLQTPATISTNGTSAIIRPIITPKGGHGSDLINELGAHFVMLNIQLNQAEGDDFTINNDFRQLGIVVDPLDKNSIDRSSDNTRRQTYAINFSNVTGSFVIDEKIVQSTTGAVGKVVDWDSTNNILYYIQERHLNHGVTSSYDYIPFSGSNNVEGTDSGSVGIVNTGASPTIVLPNNNSIIFNAGYCDPEMEPDSGNIIYLENRKPISRAADQTEDIKITIEF